ncbi:exosome non-catalytic core subunit rrp40 [Umbelopsis sp. WA50703]
MTSDLKVVLPGDLIPVNNESDESSMNVDDDAPLVRLGPGLTQVQEDIVSMKAGVLKHQDPGNKWWLESNQRRYVAATGESVIGIVVARLAEYYRVDIGGAQAAILPVLAFEGATKKNKPNLVPGTLVYARISLANKDMEPELQCFNPSSGKADGYGELKGGFVIKCSLGLCRRLLNPETPILRFLGEHFPFETAVGMNGRIWVNSESPQYTILLANAVKNSEYLSEAQCKAMVESLIDKL